MSDDGTPARVWPEVMLVDEAADYLRIASRTLLRLAREGRVPARKVGGEWRFHRLALEDYFRQPRPEGDDDEGEHGD
ncbi:helix-turn-helix domain-containing protein [uncultured Pseudokineococcus sp.]|uniref:helix-turn-helix domain-containing protein n=1 Tax=uncultured Pseudokineococcus sp. TaxID=1642928 RepID=UPI0026315AC7|nr:helix-turn-helix domain-containing protein [uncultured Pseudokineococcus sp.]